jgi:glycolate oxidase FAD binding subunit
MEARVALRLEPQDADEVTRLVRSHATEGVGLEPVGAGTKLHWRPARADRPRTRISLAGITEPFDHRPGDLTATVPAGVTLRALNDRLAAEGQWLPLDPLWAEATTIGGLVATNDSGPRRHKYGAPRDLLIGIELVLADGRRVRGGGQVVKNVAGYDLPRLICGSWGSLAIVTAATFKLLPRPAASRTVVAHGLEPPRLAALALEVAAAPVAPSCIDLHGTPARLLVRVESTPGATEQQADAVAKLCAAAGASVDVLEGPGENDAWSVAPALLRSGQGLLAAVAVLPTASAHVIDATERIGAGAGAPAVFAGRAADGVWLIRVAGNAAVQSAAVADLAAVAAASDGHLRILEADEEVRDRHKGDQDESPAARLMGAVKARFDPHGLLPPAGLG